jgi:hypothetical protein
MILFLSHPPHVSKLSLFLSLPVCHCMVELTAGKGGMEEPNQYDGKKALSAIIHSIFSGYNLKHRDLGILFYLGGGWGGVV